MLKDRPYIGRFAPSPTGSLHLGSLCTALVSFLEARTQLGLWLLRIDDLDTTRNIKGSVDNILNTLSTFGLHWDHKEQYQSHHIKDYEEILFELTRNQHTYACTCNRKSLLAKQPCLCRNTLKTQKPSSLRIKINPSLISFQDQLQGLRSFQLTHQDDDFLLKRRDGIIAYQFAVVIDDNRQQVTDIVRGVDLLDSTPRQIYLQQLLGLSTPNYMHLPIIIDQDGNKLSKQNHATAVDLKQPQIVIFKLLSLLKQNPPKEIYIAPVKEQLEWAIDNWNPLPLKNLSCICNND